MHKENYFKDVFQPFLLIYFSQFDRSFIKINLSFYELIRMIHAGREVQFVHNESCRCGSLVCINCSRRKEVLHSAQAQLIRRKQTTLAPAAAAAAMADEKPKVRN